MAVSFLPHTAPVSSGYTECFSHSTLGRFNDAQCPNRMRVFAVFLAGIKYQGTSSAEAAIGVLFSEKFIAPCLVKYLHRVKQFAMNLSRSLPASLSFQVVGSLPYIDRRNSLLVPSLANTDSSSLAKSRVFSSDHSGGTPA